MSTQFLLSSLYGHYIHNTSHFHLNAQIQPSTRIRQYHNVSYTAPFPERGMLH